MGRELDNMGAQLCATTLCCAADDTKSTLIEPQSPSSDTLDHPSYDPPRHSVPSTSDDRDTPNPTRHRLPLRGDRAVSEPAAKRQAESTKPTSHRLPLSADRAARKHAAGATQPSIERRIRQLEQQIYGARHVGGIVMRLAEMEQTVSAHQSSSLTVCERVDGLEQLVLSASMSSRSDWSASSSSETSATADEANKSRLTRWFEQFDPESLGKEEEYLKAYQGRQPALFDALELKYHGSGSGSQPNVPTSATALSLPQYTEQQRGDNQRSQGRSQIKWGSTTGSGDCDLPGATSVINSQCTPESSQMSSSLVQSETTRSDDHVSEVEHQQTTPENTTAPILISPLVRRGPVVHGKRHSLGSRAISSPPVCQPQHGARCPIKTLALSQQEAIRTNRNPKAPHRSVRLAHQTSKNLSRSVMKSWGIFQRVQPRSTRVPVI